MQTNNISTNIIRDSNKKLDYIVTPNSKEIFETIFVHNNKSIKSFNLIGNYGTGKSTFLWALERNLKNEELFFSHLDKLNEINSFDFIKIIGDNNTFSNSISIELGLNENADNKEIINALEKKRLNSKKNKKGLIILVDEFGKFLEYAAKNNLLEELFLLQKLAEWANNDETDSYFILTLHQNFASYGKGLNDQDKLEWEKIKGRFKDLLFNEPVEQLLFFASNKLKELKIEESSILNFNSLLKLIKESNLISYNNLITDSLSESLFPLDWISSTVLVNSLQRYGQNERSLFSFLNDNSEVSIRRRKNHFYTVSNVFDYLVYTLPGEITGAENPHKPQWSSTFKAIERAELIFDEEYHTAVEVIKTIGLSNIFTKAGGLFNGEFINRYFIFTRNIDVTKIINKLEKAGIVRFYKHSNKINFLEGTDLDLEQELISVSKDINSNFSISNEIINLIEFPIILAKQYSSLKGTPRFFEYRVCNSLNNLEDAAGVMDGYVNLLFDEFNIEEIKDISKSLKSNIFVLYNNTKYIKETVFTLLRLERLISKHIDDINAVKLLKDEKEFHSNILKSLVNEDLFSSKMNIWIYNGVEKSIKSKYNLNEIVTQICFEIYPETPYFFNELINKEFLSSPINSARKYLVKKIIENENDYNLGFENDKFPPEKAIYLSLLKKTNIHRLEKDTFGLFAPSENSENKFEKSLFPIWEECDKFLRSCFSKNRNLQELYMILSKAPYKLKKGFVDFWIPIYLLANREHFALFHNLGGFIPYISDETLDLIHKKPVDFEIKSYNVSGFKINILEGYKGITQIESINGLNSTFLSIFGNFLRFQRSLTHYALKTNNLSPQAIRLRDSIKLAKDPEDALFNKFPEALGFYNINSETDTNKLITYVNQLQNCIKEIREVYSDLIDEIEKQLIKALVCKENKWPIYKVEILNKLKSIELEKLSKNQRIFYERLVSPLDDRLSYIKSIADAAINKRIEDLHDDEKTILFFNIKEYSKGLIEAIEIHKFNASNINSKMISFNIVNENGINVSSKIILNAFDNESNNDRKSIKSILQKMPLETQKEILIDLFNELIKLN